MGLLASRAQSMGECPGVSFTCLVGFFGIAECVGGGARPDMPAPAPPRLGMGRLRLRLSAAGDEDEGDGIEELREGIRGAGGGAIKPGDGDGEDDEENRGMLEGLGEDEDGDAVRAGFVDGEIVRLGGGIIRLGVAVGVDGDVTGLGFDVGDIVRLRGAIRLPGGGSRLIRLEAS